MKSKIKGYLDNYKRYAFLFFETCENWIIKLHQYVNHEFNLEYPLDILLFAVLGFLFYHLASSFKSKDKFVYNFPDNPDVSTLINNVNIFFIQKFKELINTAKTIQKASNENVQPTPSSNENKAKIEQKLSNLSSEVEKLNASIKNSNII